MKKISLVFAVIVIFSAMFAVNVFAVKYGERLGDVLNTDIKVYIDNQQIPSYAVNNKMAVIMEDLNKYGFDVKYDNDTRTLQAIRRPDKAFNPVENIEINTNKPGSVAFPYVYTDIKAYLANEKIDCFAINGKLVIYIDDLKNYGKFVWNSKERALYLNLSTKTPTAYDFDNAWISWVQDEKTGVVTAIRQICMRFNGKQNFINPNDFTDLKLTRDGIAVNNKLTFNGRTEYWSDIDKTNFYFSFAEENIEPGIYNLTGKYKGLSFKSDYKIVESLSGIGNIAANKNDLHSVEFAFVGESIFNPTAITGIWIYFNLTQQSLYQTDLTDLKLTLNGKDIKFSLTDKISRYIYYTEDTKIPMTVYTLNFKESFISPGTYQLTGKYMGILFNSSEMTIK